MFAFPARGKELAVHPGVKSFCVHGLVYGKGNSVNRKSWETLTGDAQIIDKTKTQPVSVKRMILFCANLT